MRSPSGRVTASVLGAGISLLAGSVAAQPAEALPKTETVEAAETAETVETVETVEAVEAAETAEAVETAETAETTETAETAEGGPQAQPAPTPPPASRPPAKKAETNGAQRFPRLVLAVHGTLGPHSVGEETCRERGSSVLCDRTGRFLGAGGSLSLRVRFYKFVYGHVRFMALGNAFGQDLEDLHDGLLAPAAGIDLMSEFALLRVEFAAPFTLGSSRYRAPGVSTLATETWGHAAGSLAIGARLPFHERVRGELTAGVWVGPGINRETPTAEGDQKGPVISFQIGLGTAFDLVGDNTRPSKSTNRSAK